MGIRMGIGNLRIDRRLCCSTWTPQKPLGGETPIQWFNSRSGLNMVDSLGGASMAIQLPYLYKPSANEYLYVADNTALDIANNLGINPVSGGNTGFTLCAWIKDEVTDVVANYFAGKNGASSVNGRYGIALGAGGAIYVGAQSSGGYKDITGTTLWTDKLPHLVTLIVDDTAKVIKLFVGHTQEGVSTAYTGTFAALTNAYEFYIGSGNSAAGAGVQSTTKSSHSDTFVYPFILTVAELTVLENRGVVQGAKFHTDCVLTEDNKALDFSGNGYHLTGVNCLMSTKKKYSSFGSRQSLEIGYTRYIDFPNKEVHVPYKDNATELIGYTPTGYTKDANNPASVTGYNLAEGYLTVTGVDRSSVVECSYLARATNLQYYYDSTNVSWLHSTELLNFNLSNYFTVNYRGLRFTKIANRVLTDFYTYATNKTGTNYDKPIIYSGETNVLKFDVIVGIHIIAIKGNKVLKFNDALPYTLSLSLDGGTTYPITKATPGIVFIDHGYIFDNGNIMFCDNTKCYYSTDNLSTYAESTVLDYQGNAFVAGTLFNFRPYDSMLDEVTTDGTKLYTWGTYATSGTALNVPNQWYTIDNGITIKSGYLFGSSLPALVATHIHSIKYDSVSDTFFMNTGDGAVNKCNIMQGVYDTGTDTWTWTSLGKGNAGTVWETDGFEFTTDWLYIANEGTTVTYRGLRRSLRADIANIATNQETIFTTNIWTGGVVKTGNYYVICQVGADDKITFTTDLTNFITRTFNELVFEATYGGYICRGTLPNGYILFHFMEVGETLSNYPGGASLLIKPSVIS
jgi:hypothetical protein